jgi:hypothetical protein
MFVVSEEVQDHMRVILQDCDLTEILQDLENIIGVICPEVVQMLEYSNRGGPIRASDHLRHVHLEVILGSLLFNTLECMRCLLILKLEDEHESLTLKVVSDAHQTCEDLEVILQVFT